MRIYRGPSSKNLGDDSHEFVDAVELGNWAGADHHVRFNVTKDGYERRASATAVLTADEVARLHASMVERLIISAARERELDAALLEIEIRVCALSDEDERLSIPLLEAVSLRAEVARASQEDRAEVEARLRSHLEQYGLVWDFESAQKS